jgi:hypothetical protein
MRTIIRGDRKTNAVRVDCLDGTSVAKPRNPHDNRILQVPNISLDGFLKAIETFVGSHHNAITHELSDRALVDIESFSEKF